MVEKDLKDRTIAFAVAITRLTERLPKSRANDVFARQLIRSASSVGANFRPAGRAQSTAHMVSKLAVVEEEADESGYWLELLVATGALTASEAAPYQREASEITAMMVASKKRLRAKLRAPSRRNSKFQTPNSEASS